jgi:SLT domain-containing protein
MQTIPSTYRAYVHPDVADRSITDPVANITAGIRYMVANYGLETLEAGGRSNSSGDYVGY